MALLDEGADVLEDHNLVDAEHDAEAHADASAWLLLNAAQNGLRVSEQHVEHDGEAQAPVDLDVWVVGQVDGQVVARVLISATLALEALCGPYNLIVLLLVIRVLFRVVDLFPLGGGHLDLVT